MFGSEILEVAIGLILLFLLFSLIMTAARETLESVMRSRASNLQKALVEMLRPQTTTGVTTAQALAAFQQHPLIYALYQGETVTPGIGTNGPSYIPPMAFANAVMDLAAAGQKLPPDSAVAKAYEIFVRQAGEGAEQVQAELAKWYDNSMERASGWYRRHTQWFLFIGGIVLAVALNLNAVVIAQHLSVDQTARESILRIAAGAAASPEPLATANFSVMQDAVSRTSLPIGWNDRTWASRPATLGGTGSTGLLELVLGYLAFAFAATLGAPFWFDLLAKVSAIRTSIKPQQGEAPAASPTRVANATPEVETGPVRDRLAASPQPHVYG
jgi:hypothetical protein